MLLRRDKVIKFYAFFQAWTINNALFTNIICTQKNKCIKLKQYYTSATSVRCTIGWNKIEGFICLCGGAYLRAFSFPKTVYNIGPICYSSMNPANNTNTNLVLTYGRWLCSLHEHKTPRVFRFISDRETYPIFTTAILFDIWKVALRWPCTVCEIWNILELILLGFFYSFDVMLSQLISIMVLKSHDKMFWWLLHPIVECRPLC